MREPEGVRLVRGDADFGLKDCQTKQDRNRGVTSDYLTRRVHEQATGGRNQLQGGCTNERSQERAFAAADRLILL